MQNLTIIEKKQIKEAMQHLMCYETASDKSYALGVLVEIDGLPKVIAKRIIKYLDL